MKTTFTKTTLILHLALAAAFLFVGMMSAAAQTTSTSTSTSTPALIMSFDGDVTNNVASLTWVMEGETNAKYTVIERSGDDGSYDSIGVVIDIDDNNTNTYTFADNNMINGNNYYRLRMVDMAGDTRYSKIVSLYASLQTTAAATSSMTVYPNPAVATINYTIASTANQQVFVQVYNLSGVALMTTEQQLTAGNNVESIAISSLKAGSYFLKITSVQGNMQYVQSFIKLM
jgi:hypothetical protein